MKNRDMFLDLMEEIDKEHLEAHIKKNTDTRSKRIKRYITAAAIYAAACVAAFLLIPVVMNHTGIVPPNNAPGAEPVITEPMAESIGTTETTDEDYLFPPPAIIRVSCEYESRSFTPGDAFYQYVYKRINERVPEEGISEIHDIETHISTIRKNEMYVEFRYINNTSKPSYIDSLDPNANITPIVLIFPLSGEYDDLVIGIEMMKDIETQKTNFNTREYGQLENDRELIDAIWDFFSYAVPESSVGIIK